MRKFVLLTSFMCLCLFGYAQKDSTSVCGCNNHRYKLYNTQNKFISLKLDTRTGRIWMVQWSTEDESRFESVLSEKKWSEILNREERNGRYELYPTTNIFNFVMLDTFSGDTFQVQWDFDDFNCGVWIIKINRGDD